MKKVISIFGIAGALLLSCNSAKNDVVAYAQNEKNGLLKKVAVGQCIYEVQYKPVGYILTQEGLEQGSPEWEKRMKDMRNTAWFNITIKVKDYNQSPLRYQVAGIDEYNERLNYYLNQAPGDIALLYGSDTLHVSSYWFENNQNLVPYEKMIAGFILPDGAKGIDRDIRFVFHDQIFNNGIIKVLFSQKDITPVQ